MWPIATSPGQRLQLLLVEDVRDEPHLAQDREAPAVGDGDPGRLLAAVLEREQAEVRETRRRPAPPNGSRRLHTSVGRPPRRSEAASSSTPSRVPPPASPTRRSGTLELGRNTSRRRARASGAHETIARPPTSPKSSTRVVTEVERSARARRRAPPRRGRPPARLRRRRGRASPAARRARGTRRAAPRPRGRAAAGVPPTSPYRAWYSEPASESADANAAKITSPSRQPFGTRRTSSTRPTAPTTGVGWIARPFVSL